MPVTETSKAPARTSTVQNSVFSPTAENVPRKIMIIGTYDPAITTVVDEVPIQITSPEDGGSKFGFGFMIHRLAVRSFKGGSGVPVYVCPQAEAGGAVAATGTITYSGTSIAAGTHALYIAGLRVATTVTAGMTPAQVATAVVASITADSTLPITAAVNGVTAEQVDITAKSKGPWGNDIDISVAILSTDEEPTNLGYVIVDMASGAGIPDIQDALDGMGTGDNANSEYWTDGVHGYGQDTTTMDAIANWVGQGDVKSGLYDELVHRPIRFLMGDVAAGSSGFTAATALGDGRKSDRAQGIVPAPGSQSHPSEIAALAIGYAARYNDQNPAVGVLGVILEDIRPGADADDWTNSYANRDAAAKAGIGLTKVENGVVKLQILLTFYHPDSVPQSSNTYSDFENISKIQNILYNNWLAFAGPTYQQKVIIDNVAKITNPTARLSAVDTDVATGTVNSLIDSYFSKTWIYEKEWAKENISVTVRTDGKGFVINMKLILSGSANIIQTNAELDTSIAVLSA